MTALEQKSDTTPSTPANRVPGEVGVWIFIFGDMAIFAILFVTYLHGRSMDAGLFAASQEELNQDFGVANTVLLLVSSLLVVLAVRSVREDRGLAPKLFACAMLCGVAFSALKVLEYSGKIDHGITPATNDFFMYYFILTGLHWFHLVLGLVVLAILIRLSRKERLTDNQLSFVEGGACFWHMVDALWIILFPLLYLVH